MKKRFYSLFFSLLLCGNLVSSASVSITGKSRVQTGDTTEYSVNPETDITSYVWKAPKGCRIIDGQGSPTIKLASTFLSQDSPLTLIREKNDNSTDTSSIDISFVHRIAHISDHSISAGDSISINGTYYKDADIMFFSRFERVGRMTAAVKCSLFCISVLRYRHTLDEPPEKHDDRHPDDGAHKTGGRNLVVRRRALIRHLVENPVPDRRSFKLALGKQQYRPARRKQSRHIEDEQRRKRRPHERQNYIEHLPERTDTVQPRRLDDFKRDAGERAA